LTKIGLHFSSLRECKRTNPTGKPADFAHDTHRSGCLFGVPPTQPASKQTTPAEPVALHILTTTNLFTCQRSRVSGSIKHPLDARPAEYQNRWACQPPKTELF